MLNSTVNQNSAVALLYRVLDISGEPITQAEVSALTCEVWDTNAGTLVNSPTLTVADCVFDTLQIDARWTAIGGDTTGYNVAIELDGDNFPTGGTTYRIETKVTPAAGSTYYLPVEVFAQPIYST